MSSWGAEYVRVPKKDKINAEEWEQKGTPFTPKTFEPVSKEDDPEKYAQQRKVLNDQEIELSNSLLDPKNIARRATGNQAPPIPLPVRYQLIDEAVESSSLPISTYNVGYARGNMLNYIEQAKELQKQGAEIVRDPETRYTDEELEELMTEYMYLKGQQPELPKWEPGMYPPDGTTVAFGRRRSGKSWLFRELIWRYNHLYRQVVVLTNTADNDFWGQYVPFRFIHKYSSFVLERVIQSQRAIMAHNKLYADEPDKLINPYMALILDDVVAEDKHHDSALNRVFYEGRHANISIFISTQHPKALPPGVRANADLAIIFPQWAEHDQEAIWKQYCTFFQDRRDFKLMLLRYTQGQQCVVAFLGDPSINPKQCLYWYKAIEPPPFLTCAEEYWVGDHEARRKYLEQTANMLTNGDIAGNNAPGGAPPGFQWMTNDQEVNSLIDQMTFMGM